MQNQESIGELSECLEFIRGAFPEFGLQFKTVFGLISLFKPGIHVLPVPQTDRTEIVCDFKIFVGPGFTNRFRSVDPWFKRYRMGDEIEKLLKHENIPLFDENQVTNAKYMDILHRSRG